ncbi:hypothetical protein ACRARG_03425 [Pseudooceanicola sp. C21-150M6]|uniref:hypothetical protein n=1 Tax=Pseudooceanicola sp. C21-150M6 TaxID=3434355 RepID=UPI003D7F9BF0
MGQNCKLVCWILAVIAGLVGYWLMRPGLAILLALILAVIIALVVGYLLLKFLCSAGAETAETPSVTPADQSRDAVTAPPAAPMSSAAPNDVPAAAPQATAAASEPAAEPLSAPQAEPTPDTTEIPADTPSPVAEDVVTDEATPAGENPVAPEETPAPRPVTADATASTAIGEAAKPEGLSAPRDTGADDLKRIKGVGPKLEQMLNGLGYYHFDQIAAWTPEQVAWVDQNLKGFKGRVSRDNWLDQAKTLAAGGDTEFSKRVDKGGVY